MPVRLAEVGPDHVPPARPQSRAGAPAPDPTSHRTEPEPGEPEPGEPTPPSGAAIAILATTGPSGSSTPDPRRRRSWKTTIVYWVASHHDVDLRESRAVIAAFAIADTARLRRRAPPDRLIRRRRDHVVARLNVARDPNCRVDTMWHSQSIFHSIFADFILVRPIDGIRKRVT